MKYNKGSGQYVAMSVMRGNIVSDIKKNLITLYLDEKDEKEQNRLLGMIEAIDESKTCKKVKLFDKLYEYEEIIRKINEYPDEYFFEEKSYYQGCCDGIRRLIGLNNELRDFSKRLFLICFAASADIAFEFHSAFLMNENVTEIFECKDIIEFEKNYFSVTSDVNNVINLLNQKDEEHEYIVLITYNSENTHNIEDLKQISGLCKENFYFVKSNENNRKAMNTGEYIKNIIHQIK